MPWADSRAAPCIDNITYQDIAVTTLKGKEPFCIAASRDTFFGFLFACFLHVLPFRISPYHGRRIGEASHPGPLTITFCATNPTAIHGKSQRICELGANFVFAAETSATEAAQYVENPNFYDHGFKVLWGHPVAPQKGEHIEHGGYRGKSMGVAAITNLPVRPVREPFLDLWKTCRFHETWIHIGGFNVLCLTVYAFPEPVNQPDKNRILLNALLERATSTAGCVLIGGDFNTMLYPDEHSDLVRARGFVDILQLAKHKWPAKCPPTCAGATFNDTILAKGPILEHLSRAWVSTPLSFGIHSPFFAEFVFPTETISYQKWQQYESTPFQHTHDPDADLLQWAAKVELSVGLSLPESADATHLPSRYGGRCQPPAFTRVQPPCVPKPANSSHFEPPSDVATFKACHTVRQTRRLQTFLRSHRAFMAEATEARTANVHKEWSAICRAKSFAPNFRSWCLSTLGSFPVDIYSVTPQWLSLAIHECRSYAETYHRKMSILRQQEFVEKLQVDWKEHGGSFTCKLLKPPVQPPLDIVTFTEDCAATRLRAFNKGQHRLKLHADLDFVPGDEIFVSGHRCEVQNAKGRIIQVDHLGEDTPVRCVIKYENGVKTVVKSLTRYKKYGCLSGSVTALRNNGMSPENSQILFARSHLRLLRSGLHSLNGLRLSRKRRRPLPRVHAVLVVVNYCSSRIVHMRISSRSYMISLWGLRGRRCSPRRELCFYAKANKTCHLILHVPSLFLRSFTEHGPRLGCPRPSAS